MKYIDLTYLNEVAGNDQKLFNELVNIFLTQMEELKNIINNAVKQQDYELIKQAAHKIKSSLRTFGAYTLASKFEEIETNNRLETYSDLEQHLSELLSEVEATSQELKAYKNQKLNKSTQ